MGSLNRLGPNSDLSSQYEVGNLTETLDLLEEAIRANQQILAEISSKGVDSVLKPFRGYPSVPGHSEGAFSILG